MLHKKQTLYVCIDNMMVIQVDMENGAFFQVSDFEEDCIWYNE